MKINQSNQAQALKRTFPARFTGLIVLHGLGEGWFWRGVSMAESGWIKLHRKIRENLLWKKPRKFSQAEAWIDILLEVRWEDEPEQVLIKNTILTCCQGESLK